MGILFYSSEDDSFGAFSILFFLLFRFVLIDLYIILCPLLLLLIIIFVIIMIIMEILFYSSEDDSFGTF